MFTPIPDAPLDPLGQRFSLTAPDSGIAYDITISEPKCPMVPDVADPPACLLYIVDGPLHGGLAVAATRVLALWLPSALNTQPVTVVSIAPRLISAEDHVEYQLRDRVRDLVPKGDPAGDASSCAESFLHFLHTQVDPAVRARTPAVKEKAILFGHGLGGLFACHALATRHPMFDRYIIASPTLLDGSPTLAALQQAPSKALAGRLYLTISGEDRLDTPAPRHDGAIGRGFHALASLTGRVHRPGLRARIEILTAESFESMAPVALIAGLRWMLPSTGRNGLQMVLRNPRGYMGMVIGMLKMLRQAKHQRKAAHSVARIEA